MTSTMEVAKGMITSGKCDATDNHSIAPMAMAAPRAATAPSTMSRKADATPSTAGRLSPFQTHLVHRKTKGGRSALPPCQSRENELLQVSHRGQVSRELHDAGCAAPVGAEPAGIDRGYEGRAEIGGAVIAREGVTIALRKVGVVVAQIQREHLVGEAYTDIPSVVAGLRNAKREWSAEGRRGRGTIECIGRSKPLTAELTRDVHAHTAAAE